MKKTRNILFGKININSYLLIIFISFLFILSSCNTGNNLESNNSIQNINEEKSKINDVNKQKIGINIDNINEIESDTYKKDITDRNVEKKENIGLKKIEEIKKSNVNESIITSNNNNFEAKASGGTTDFLTFNINASNFEENNSKVDGVIEKSYLKKDKLQIILEASNHVYSYEDANYLSDITLSNINPTDYKIISTKMGGHHVVVILDFPLGTKIDELKFNNSPVGDISLVFNK